MDFNCGSWKIIERKLLRKHSFGDKKMEEDDEQCKKRKGTKKQIFTRLK